jgi:eukaryotic-like serine/threonine-protein kinase
MNDLVGKTLGHYRLEGELRTGSTGQMFRGVDTLNSRPVAIKVLQSNGLVGNLRQEFVGKIRQLGALKHPHIVEVFEIGEENDNVFLAMEFISGGSLSTLLQRNTRANTMLELPVALGLMYQAADALSFAHKNNVIHGDINPENMLVNSQSGTGSRAYNLKVGDFGLSKLSADRAMSFDDLVIGSPAYMSPEQCQGLALTAASDLYSLGIVIYETLTTVLPFEVKNLGEAAIKHLYSAPRSPREIRPEIPEELEGLIMRLLAKNPNDRYASTIEVRDALQGILERIEPQGPTPTLVLPNVGSEPKPPNIAALPDTSESTRITLADQSGRILKVLTVPNEGLRFGRTDQNDVQLDSEMVSRYHLRIDTQAQRIVVTDLGSSNGTMMDGQKLDVQKPAAWAYRSILHVGPFWLRLDAPTAASAKNVIGLVLNEDKLTIAPGQVGVLRVTVGNMGRIVDHFTFTADGIPANWLVGPENPVQLNPGSQAPVALSIVVPRSSEASSGTRGITIRAHSREFPEALATSKVALTILPFAMSSLILKPNKRTVRRSTQFVATLKNQGNTALDYYLQTEEEEPRLKFHFSEPVVALEPGQSRDVILKTTAPLRILGAAQQRPFTLAARATSSQKNLPDSTQIENKTGLNAKEMLTDAKDEAAKRAGATVGTIAEQAMNAVEDAVVSGKGIDLGRIAKSAVTRVGNDAAAMQHQAAQKAFKDAQGGAAKAGLGILTGGIGRASSNAVPFPEDQAALPGADPMPVKAQLTHLAIMPMWLPTAILALLAFLIFWLTRPPTITTFIASTLSPILEQPVSFNFESSSNNLELRRSDQLETIKIPSGSKTFTLEKGFAKLDPIKMTLIAKGNFGSRVEKELQLTPKALKPEVLEFTVNPPKLIKGTPVTIRWKVKNAEKVTIEPFGVQALEGRITDKPVENRTYTLVAINKNERISIPIKLGVNYQKPKITGFSITPRTVIKGQDLKITVYIKAPNSVITNLEPYGKVDEQDIVEIAAPEIDTDYTLSAENPAGKDSRTIRVKVVEPVVKETPIDNGGGTTTTTTDGGGGTTTNNNNGTTDGGSGTTTTTPDITPKAPEAVASIQADKTTIKSGESINLTWKTQNAKSVKLEPLGKVSLSGQRPVSPKVTTTYTLTAINSDGVETASEVTINVTRGASTIKPPTAFASLKANKTTINRGESIALTWQTANASSVQLEPIGAVKGAGRQVLKPDSDITYTLTATGKDGKTSSSTVKITVKVPLVAGVLNGRWYHNFGALNLKHIGSVVTGTFTSSDGSNGSINANLEGQVLSGTYTAGGAKENFEWTFSDDFRTFNGRGDTHLQWCGAKPGVYFNPGCSYSGQWNASINGVSCTVNLTRTNNDVIGKFCDGTLTGRVSFQKGKIVLTGTWSNTKLNTAGDFSFALSDSEAIQFTGRQNRSNEWCGWRQGSSKPNPCILK